MWLYNQNNLDFVKSWINSYTIFLRGQFDTHLLWYCKYFLRTGLMTGKIEIVIIQLDVFVIYMPQCNMWLLSHPRAQFLNQGNYNSVS